MAVAAVIASRGLAWLRTSYCLKTPSLKAIQYIYLKIAAVRTIVCTYVRRRVQPRISLKTRKNKPQGARPQDMLEQLVGEGEEGMACYLYHTLVIPPWLEADKVYIRSRCRVSGCVDAAGRI